MILTDKTILEEIEKGNILIAPYRPECLGTNSYDVHLIMSCTRGVAEDTTLAALNKMRDAGVKFYEHVDDFYNTFKNDIIYSNHTK